MVGKEVQIVRTVVRAEQSRMHKFLKAVVKADIVEGSVHRGHQRDTIENFYKTLVEI
jgi:hypothetical protein